jgi:hypothetical protein
MKTALAELGKLAENIKRLQQLRAEQAKAAQKPTKETV